MASSSQPEVPREGDRSAAPNIPSSSTITATAATSPVELNSLDADTPLGSGLDQSITHKSTGDSQMPHGPMRTDTTTAILSAQNPPSSPPPLPALPQLDRTQSTAIGPPTDAAAPAPAPKDEQDAGPTLMITLLLLNGARHPFNLNAPYLAKRNVQVSGNNPFNLSVYKVKELILREWRPEWESKPASPSAIRLIHFGKVLDDKTAMKDLRISDSTPNVIHMSVKPQDFMDDEDAKGSKATRAHSQDGAEARSPGCRCLVM